MIKGKNAHGCSEWKNGCKFTIPYTICPADANIEELRKHINNEQPR